MKWTSWGIPSKYWQFSHSCFSFLEEAFCLFSVGVLQTPNIRRTYSSHRVSIFTSTHSILYSSIYIQKRKGWWDWGVFCTIVRSGEAPTWNGLSFPVGSRVDPFDFKGPAWYLTWSETRRRRCCAPLGQRLWHSLWQRNNNLGPKLEFLYPYK